MGLHVPARTEWTFFVHPVRSYPSSHHSINIDDNSQYDNLSMSPKRPEIQKSWHADSLHLPEQYGRALAHPAELQRLPLHPTRRAVVLFVMYLYPSMMH
ncbi:hypothetical protein A0H81_02649 [Grifola frondosa]|uniref:Uncharacterized protein n=1 Tax=Grifola frondosa TaxID=5627 RepID=A0A1C7MML5_GRIFR|nr:hypothetical protein A0H81_02649 [Grifola frondosa]